MNHEPTTPTAPTTAKPSWFRRLGLGAFSISLAVHGILAVLAVFFFYQWIYPPAEQITFTAPGGGGGGAGGEVRTKIMAPVRSPVSPAANRKIAVQGVSEFVLPESSNTLFDSALPSALANLATLGGAGSGGGSGGGKGLGSGAGNGTGTGSGIGPGIGQGFMSPFGDKHASAGSLLGSFYDFKQSPDGKPTPGYDISSQEDYSTRITSIQESDFRERAFRRFFKAPDSLHLTQLAIPITDASQAPKFFNVENKVKPSGWLIVYNGRISATRDITFRFVGTGDDYISVWSNRRPVLINAWTSLREQVSGRWKPSEPIDTSAPSPLPGGPLAKGNWIHLRRGEKLDLAVSIGERPGGKVGFVLMIEEKGTTYRVAPNGAQVLPLFTTASITSEARDRITKDFPNWEFEWENVPVFGTDKFGAMEDALR